MDVGLTSAEAPKADVHEYRFTVPIPTPTIFSWHNLYASGLITKGMIPQGVDSVGSSPLYYVAITGGLDGALDKSTGAGNFRLSYDQPLVNWRDRDTNLGDHTVIRAEFKPYGAHAASLRTSQLEVVSTLRRT